MSAKTRKFPVNEFSKYVARRNEMVRLEVPRWVAEQIQKLIDGINKELEQWGR